MQWLLKEIIKNKGFQTQVPGSNSQAQIWKLLEKKNFTKKKKKNKKKRIYKDLKGKVSKRGVKKRILLIILYFYLLYIYIIQ